MKVAVLFLIPFLFQWSDAKPKSNVDFKISSAVQKTSGQEFLKFQGAGPWDNYLSLNLPFEPVADLFRQLLIKEKKQLTSRGEAHITVITPVEYWNVLKAVGITMEDLHKIAEENKIQSSKFEILCLGEGKAVVDNKEEQTYFVVVKSEDLLKIRNEVQKLFLSKGGDADEFKAAHYYPHITVAFTKRDLHESDGVVKDVKTCVGGLGL